MPVNHRIVIAGKRGTVYLLKPTLGGVGSALRTLDGCQAFGGAAVSGHTVLMPCKGQTSIRALTVGLALPHLVVDRTEPVLLTRHCWTSASTWPTRAVATSSSCAFPTDSCCSGSMPASLPHFPSEVVDGGHVFVPTLTGVTAFVGVLS